MTTSWYDHFMQCVEYKGIDRPLIRDQDVPLLKKAEKGRREKDLRSEGHHKGLRHMVIVQSL